MDTALRTLWPTSRRSADLHTCTEMATTSPLWDAPRIHGELRTLSVEVSEANPVENAERKAGETLRGDVKQARRVLQGVAPRHEGVDGLAWTVDRRLLYTAYTGDNLSIWSMNSDGGDLRHLTSSGAAVVDSQLCVTADARYIVFQSNRSGAMEIWRANMDGTGLMSLTTSGGNSLPSVSPDSRWVVYTSTRDGQSTLWRMSIDGGEASPVTTQSATWPQISPASSVKVLLRAIVFLFVDRTSASLCWAQNSIEAWLRGDDDCQRLARDV